jgi:hypothetical protein
MRSGPTALLAGGVAYSLIAASTTPFTLPADVLTGLAILAMAVLVVVRWPLRTRMTAIPPDAMDAPRPPIRPAVRSSARPGVRPYLPWVLLLIAFVAWELFNYLAHGTRANHPTFSSITDANDRFYVLKSLLFLGWMAAAWVIIGRGTGQRAVRGNGRSPATPPITGPIAGPGAAPSKPAPSKPAPSKPAERESGP